MKKSQEGVQHYSPKSREPYIVFYKMLKNLMKEGTTNQKGKKK